jgi:hypothetical protein
VRGPDQLELVEDVLIGEPRVSDDDDFYQAFFAGILAARLELRDHWHPKDDSAVTYMLRDPQRKGDSLHHQVRVCDGWRRRSAMRRGGCRPLLRARNAQSVAASRHC